MTARAAFVTGGAGGLGAAICRELARGGCTVAVADLDEGSARSVASVIGGTGVRVDVTDAASVAAAVRSATDAIGPLTVLVNCAGWDEFRPFLDTDESFSERVLAINLAGPIRVTRAVLPSMVDAGWGRIVNVASDAGRVGSSLESIYSGAKGGLIAFTKTIAREHARQGITANSVCPGPADTPLLDTIVGSGESASKVIAAMTRSIPMRRLAAPDDVAPAVAFLASEDAGYITGQTLSVSGGLTMA